jgi:hypothetical protein
MTSKTLFPCMIAFSGVGDEAVDTPFQGTPVSGAL